MAPPSRLSFWTVLGLLAYLRAYTFQNLLVLFKINVPGIDRRGNVAAMRTSGLASRSRRYSHVCVVLVLWSSLRFFCLPPPRSSITTTPSSSQSLACFVFGPMPTVVRG